MIVTYGGFSFNDNEAMVTSWGRQTQFDSRARARVRRHRMVIEGEVISDGAAAIDARIAAIEEAFELSGQDAALLIPPSTATHIGLDNGTSLSGVRVVDFHVPQRDGRGDYATGLEFRIALEASYLLSPGDDLTAYVESITYIGDGGPRKAVIELVEGAPVTQYTTEQTPIVILQTGEATGILSYPDANPALIPSLIDRPDGIQITRDVPRCENGDYVDYTVRWSYRMTMSADDGIAANLPAFPTPEVR